MSPCNLVRGINCSVEMYVGKCTVRRTMMSKVQISSGVLDQQNCANTSAVAIIGATVSNISRCNYTIIAIVYKHNSATNKANFKAIRTEFINSIVLLIRNIVLCYVTVWIIPSQQFCLYGMKIYYQNIAGRWLVFFYVYSISHIWSPYSHLPRCIIFSQCPGVIVYFGLHLTYIQSHNSGGIHG